jgi:16S rRNA (guanine966-N2)-methyltransferase
MDSVKGTIFNMLQNRLRLNGARVLDLFAGTGSLGMEAISRGALLVVFVDTNVALLNTITDNAAVLGCADSCRIVQADALSYAQASQDRFDLIFADPPYAYERTLEIPQTIFDGELLSPVGILIIEHTQRAVFSPSQQYEIAIEKKFGNTRLSFFVHPS